LCHIEKSTGGIKMSSRKWIAATVLLLFSAALVFAGGGNDTPSNSMMGQGPRGGMGPNGRMGMQDLETLTVEGTFSMVDDQYPALVTSEGKTFYLMMGFRVDSKDLPAEGAALKLEAAKSPMSPDVLMVFGGEVDGKELAAPRSARTDDAQWCGPEGYGGGQGGMMGGPNKGRGYGQSGGAKPGWGYPEAPKS
jgi:hypothetical protein